MTTKKSIEQSLEAFQQAGLRSIKNHQKLYAIDADRKYGDHIHIAIEIAAENNFLSQQVLNDLFNNREHAWLLASILVYFKKDNLIPTFTDKKSPAAANTSANVTAILEAELQARVYQTVMNNLQDLSSLSMSLKYLSMNGLLKDNIHQVLNIYQQLPNLNLALHNLNGALRLNQQALDKLFADPELLADPERANQIAKEIYQTPLVEKPEAKQPLPTIIEKPKLKIHYPKPPKIIIRRGMC